MNEIFDRLIIRVILVFFICLIFVAFKYLHLVFYPATKRQMTNPINARGSLPETLHSLSRVLGLAIVMSSLSFDESSGFFLTLFHFLVWSLISSVAYLVSVFLIENIILYHFEYKEEILKKSNISYAIISFAHAFSVAIILRSLIRQSENSFIIFFTLWLIGLVVIGFSGKYFNFIARSTLSQIVNQKNLTLSFSYLGYSLGFTFLFTESLLQEHYDIALYCVQILLKVLLSLIIYPLFKMGLERLFKIKEPSSDITPLPVSTASTPGLGIYDGFMYFTAAILTSLVVNQINFGTIYPFF